jgi:predicted acetyltransferase
MTGMLRIVRPSVEFRETFLHGLRGIPLEAERRQWVYLGDAADLSFPERDFAGYVDTLRRSEHVAPAHFVRGVTYWGVVGDRMVGRLGLRLELNEVLARVGGHIGYYVSPDCRRKGYAAAMLRLALRTPEARGIGRLLLTCDEDNTASERTILGCGGVFESVVEDGPAKPRKKRFWIDVRDAG